VAYLEQVKETVVTPPNLTFDKTMTLIRGGREIRILYLGRGHTDTDVVVYLPKERIVCTGDLMESVPSYMGDSFPEEWIATLERLKAIDFDTTMPGHGVVFTGKAKIEAFQKYLRDAITQVTALKKQGLSAEAAAAKVDLTAHANEFATIRAAGSTSRRCEDLSARRSPRVASSCGTSARTKMSSRLQICCAPALSRTVLTMGGVAHVMLLPAE
jgi:glyoxylase-like metal-dependent hydrolase (beta-lactamase superfamily II)